MQPNWLGHALLYFPLCWVCCDIHWDDVVPTVLVHYCDASTNNISSYQRSCKGGCLLFSPFLWFFFHPVMIISFVVFLLHFTLVLFLCFTFGIVGLFQLSNLGIECHYFFLLGGQQSPLIHLDPCFVHCVCKVHQFLCSKVAFICDEIIA